MYFDLHLFYTLNLFIIFLCVYREETVNVEGNVEMVGFCDAAGKGIQTDEFVFQKQCLVQTY